MSRVVIAGVAPPTDLVLSCNSEAPVAYYFFNFIFVLPLTAPGMDLEAVLGEETEVAIQMRAFILTDAEGLFIGCW